MDLPLNRCLFGDCAETLASLPDGCVQTVVTSPPYFGLRDYGVDGQIGLEETPGAYIEKLVEVFREVRRVLRDDGTLWLNLGDSYAGSWGAQGTRETPGEISRNSIRNHPKLSSHTGALREEHLKAKDLIGIPWRVAFALQADGWYLRQDIIWHKPNPMPESVRDRCTKAHEYIFLLSKSERYYYDQEAVREPVQSGPSDVRKMREGLPRIGGKHKDNESVLDKASKFTNIGRKRSVGNGEWRNKRSVWTVATRPYRGAHFATFPTALVEPCILAASRPSDVVLDPFLGSGTTAQVAQELGRHWIGCELNPTNMELQRERTRQPGLAL